MPTAHMIVGPVGVGKTTTALHLAGLGALRFSIDEWMGALFWPDAPGEDVYPWALERVVRCEAMILQTGLRAMTAGLDTVLDLGFLGRAQRLRVRATLEEAGHRPTVHLLEAPREERWARVARRNAERGATHALDVTRGTFDFAEGLWEPPEAEELAGLHVVRGA